MGIMSLEEMDWDGRIFRRRKRAGDAAPELAMRPWKTVID